MVYKDGFSVIICCYNSELKISSTLRHLASQTFSSHLFEIIIVDNNCSDKTIDVVKKTWDKLESPILLSVIEESNSGLTNARKAGVEASNFKYVLFCDDDNSLSNNYLELGYNVFKNDSRIGAVGGKGNVPQEFVNKLPDWFENFSHAFACGQQNDKSGYVTKTRKFLFGAGLCAKTTLVKEILLNTNSNLIDRTKEKLSSGGDSEICLKLAIAGHELYYNESMVFTHYIDQKRLNWAYLHNLYFAFGQSHFFLFPLEYELEFGKKINRIPSKILLKYWKENLKNCLQYLVKGPVYSGTIKGAWLLGFSKEWFKNILVFKQLN